MRLILIIIITPTLLCIRCHGKALMRRRYARSSLSSPSTHITPGLPGILKPVNACSRAQSTIFPRFTVSYM